ncbi:uncharacterized protein I206_104018 [Kwoniella pini CBS 10737]|uniref:Uncharacterized protein n=1 Tax=Kwoniella pini CBS 10737 TaxID=1296096 RepID=A0A1B9I2W6_9TREE|nr:uncharacterized protein I206_04407 [Kwoniella pini CBS 10737]OCF49879.1 hypothetical protein I206_04407 [Kwoniella pini CBS 10737]
MSLSVSPSSSSPLTIHSRPLPPNRKRNSYTPSPRATPRITPESSFADQGDVSILASPNVKQHDGTLGGLRERSEEELARADREELEEALKREWQHRDYLLQRIEQAESERKNLVNKQEELIKGMNALQARGDEAYNEQSRMEADLEERDELLERLRKRLADSERQARESQKRYIEQEQTFEIERQALQAQENHLQQRLKSLSSSSSSIRRSVTPTPPSDTENVSSLKDELASLNLSHSTLLAKLNTITKELHELKILNQELVEENEGWEFLVRERTMNGKLRQEGGLLSNEDEEEIYSEPRQNARLDPELEEEMSELASDLDNQSPIFDDDHQFFATNLDREEKWKSGQHLAPPSKSRKGKKDRAVSGSTPVEPNGSGLDLASELGKADEKPDENASVVSDSGKHIEIAALRSEVKQLKESNKALTLYCSKIIDRIIAQEGFEHVLSVDYKTRRATTRAASGSSTRPALKDVLNIPRGMTTSPISEESPAIVTTEPSIEPVKPKKARPLSMMVRAMTGPTEKSVPPAATQPPVTEESKADKRARRGFSLDFRSMGFGASSYTAPNESSKSSLRPLTLSSKSTSTSGRSSSARKLDIHEEDEEDRKERHRMEATMKLMGINRTPSPSIPEDPNEGNPSYLHQGKANWISSIRTSASSSRKSSETPLERLSSTIGMTEDNSISFEDVNDPKTAIQALKAFDEREAQKRKEIQKGKRNSIYTSPPKIGLGRRISIEHKEDEDLRNRTISKSESINTLWSIGGGDSRPNSGEIVLDKK